MAHDCYIGDSYLSVLEHGQTVFQQQITILIAAVVIQQEVVQVIIRARQLIYQKQEVNIIQYQTVEE